MQDYLTNASLRERFRVEEGNKAIISRYIREPVKAGSIKPFNEDILIWWNFAAREVKIDRLYQLCNLLKYRKLKISTHS